jgi:hypothetical protein
VAAELIGEVQTRHYGDSGGIGRGRTGGDGMHEVVHGVGCLDEFLGIPLGEKRVRRVEDRYSNRLLSVHLLPKCIDMSE